MPVFTNRGIVALPVGGAATTWNPSDYGGNGSTLTFSNVNRTWTRDSGGNTDLHGRSIAATTSNQKVYIEHTINTVVFQLILGFCQGGFAINGTGRFLRSEVTPSLGFIVNTGGTFQCLDSADHPTSVIPSFTTGDAVDIAFDTGSGKVWFRKNNGTWNVTSGGGDPAAGTGGMSVPFSGPYYAGYGADSDDPDSITTNFASTDWARSAPSGFTQLAA